MALAQSLNSKPWGSGSSARTSGQKSCRLSTPRAHSMRERRAGVSSSLGVRRATRLDMRLKSKMSAWLPPTAARSASGCWPAWEWAHTARRMSESLRISASATRW